MMKNLVMVLLKMVLRIMSIMTWTHMDTELRLAVGK
jgi:hypothetical protein